VVVDARGHMLGRLASILAKQLLNGQQIVSAPLFGLFFLDGLTCGFLHILCWHVSCCNHILYKHLKHNCTSTGAGTLRGSRDLGGHRASEDEV
jgi:hypothetical protein